MRSFMRFFDRIAARLALAVVGSLLLVAAVFPELPSLNYSPIRFMDSEFIYTAVFSIAQDFLGGRLQLWNEYDQMPLAFYYLTGGMTYANVLTGMTYALSSVFVSDQAQWFFTNYTIVYNVVTTIIRALGIYLLVSLFTRNVATMFLTSIFAATVATIPNYLGLNCGSLYALLPFVAFFLLRWVDVRRTADLMLFLTSLTIAVAFDPLVGLGYFYQGVHFLILSSLLWLGVARLCKGAALERSQAPAGGTGKAWYWVGALLAIVVVMGPWVALLITNYGDYELAHETSRFVHPLSASAYFGREYFSASPKKLLALPLMFSSNQWAFDWLFLGWTFMYFVYCGVFLALDRRKYIFILTAAAFWLMQYPRDPTSLWSIVHWINALTNPFSSVVRSAHMTGAMLMPYVLLPLFVLGVDAFFNACRRSTQLPSKARVSIFTFWIAIVAVTAARYSIHSEETRNSAELAYIYVIPLLYTCVLLASRVKQVSSAMLMASAAAVVGLSVLSDVAALRHYISEVAVQMKVVAHRFDGLPESVQPLMVDRQNPHIQPVREYYAFESPGQPTPYIGTDPINMQGLLYQYVNLGKYLDAPSNYKPRHKSYRALHFDPIFRTYLSRDLRISLLADAAVRDRPGVFEHLVAAKLERRVIVLSGADEVAEAWSPAVAARLPALSAADSPTPWHEVRFRVADAYESKDDANGLLRLAFYLPDSFPHWLASTPLTADRDNLTVRMGGRDLVPAQGWLDRPGRFDLQNIHPGRLHLLVSRQGAGDNEEEVLVRYRFATPVNAETVHTRAPDVLGFTIRVDRPHWLLVHMPFDERWSFSVNGEPTRHYRANRSFTAIRLPVGTNDVVASYWPNSPLRLLVPLSFLVCIGMLILLFRIGFRLVSARRRVEDGADVLLLNGARE